MDFIKKANLILYVADQGKATAFYRAVFDTAPTLDVPGMTEFTFPNGTILGLMPEAGIKRLLGRAITDPAIGNGTPRAELYLQVDEPAIYLRRAIELGARELSPLIPRDWGDTAGYCADLDGHVLAFARQTRGTV